MTGWNYLPLKNTDNSKQIIAIINCKSQKCTDRWWVQLLICFIDELYRQNYAFCINDASPGKQLQYITSLPTTWGDATLYDSDLNRQGLLDISMWTAMLILTSILSIKLSINQPVYYSNRGVKATTFYNVWAQLRQAVLNWLTIKGHLLFIVKISDAWATLTLEKHFARFQNEQV